VPKLLRNPLSSAALAARRMLLARVAGDLLLPDVLPADASLMSVLCLLLLSCCPDMAGDMDNNLCELTSDTCGATRSNSISRKTLRKNVYTPRDAGAPF
jgi:hypothetical protein